MFSDIQNESIQKGDAGLLFMDIVQKFRSPLCQPGKALSLVTTV